MILDELPDGMTPQEFLNTFLQAPNAVPDSAVFDALNEFEAKKAGSHAPWEREAEEFPTIDLPEVEGGPQFEGSGLPNFNPEDVYGGPKEGDWYNIQIPGNNGDVMIVDKDVDDRDGDVSATVQTMTDGGPGPAKDHPVSGRRQFGIEKLPEGGYRFYTRGVDRATNSAMDNDIGRRAQHESWSAMMRNTAEKHGGRAEHTDAMGNPVWGWHEHYTDDELLNSGVRQPRNPAP